MVLYQRLVHAGKALTGACWDTTDMNEHTRLRQLWLSGKVAVNTVVTTGT